jgi:hypothetical protein
MQLGILIVQAVKIKMLTMLRIQTVLIRIRSDFSL